MLLVLTLALAFHLSPLFFTAHLFSAALLFAAHFVRPALLFAAHLFHPPLFFTQPIITHEIAPLNKMASEV